MKTIFNRLSQKMTTLQNKNDNVEDSTLRARFDNRTEDFIALLEEKTENLWAVKKYYDIALQLKEELKQVKQEKAEKTSEINILKKQWGEIGKYIMDNHMEINKITDFSDFIMFLQIIQYTNKDDVPINNILKTMKKLNITKEELQENYNDLYTNLKIKDW